MFTGMFWRFLVLETFVIAAICSRCNEHHQQRFCASDSVNYVKVLTRLFNVEDSRGYGVEVKKVYKGNSTVNSTYGLVVPRSKRLTVGEKYIIFASNSGRKFNETCRGNVWTWGMPKYYRRFLRSKYKQGCNCVAEIGNFSPTRSCYWRYSYMTKRNNTCTWILSKKFNKCEIDRLNKTVQNFFSYH